MTSAAKPLGSRFRRAPQGIGEFAASDPLAGYYNDLTVESLRHGSAANAEVAFSRMTADRRLANPITIAQLGLGSLQLASRDDRWLRVAHNAARWVADDLDEQGLLAFRFSMPHTFPLTAPWSSSMAQGEAVSLLIRAAARFDDRDYNAAAALCVRGLLDPDLGLIADTAEGPVLQEYPTLPPAHVLNGWIFSLWGLFDFSLTDSDPTRAAEAAAAFASGSQAAAQRLPLYDLTPGWSRYDLFPHRLKHAASPFYHRLHVAQLRAMARLCPHLPEFGITAERWGRSASRPVPLVVAVTRKAAFRLLTPRKPIS